MITLVSVLHVEDDEAEQQALTGLVLDRDLPWNITLAMTVAGARKHGGDIEARSAGLGRGSEFVVRLPLARGC